MKVTEIRTASDGERCGSRKLSWLSTETGCSRALLLSPPSLTTVLLYLGDGELAGDCIWGARLGGA